MTWTHTHHATLDAPPSQVFRALTDPAALERWFAEHVDVGDAPGAPYRFWGRHTLGSRDGGPPRQTITAYVPNEALGFRWPLLGVDTEVRYALAPEGDGTRLTVTHDVPGDLGMPRERELIEDHWHLVAGNLRAHLGSGDDIMRPDYDDPAPEVRITMTIAAPVDVVFRALIEPERINRWFGTNAAEVDPRVGGRYATNWRYKIDGRDVAGGPTTILEMVPNERLVLDWPDWRGDATVTGQTITFQLEPIGDASTRLTFVHAGFGRATDIGDYPFGWQGFLGGLKEEAEGSGAAQPPAE
ncbi:MAG: SRPBCC domain-containing protein [Gemmatirosa sp.]|nr:SRPBCC domain-containing protein [Gemmatirosa sp.]